MKQVLLGKPQDLTAFTSKDETRFVLNGLHITEEGVEATNGIMAARVPHCKQSIESFPSEGEADAELNDKIISKSILDHFKKLPKKGPMNKMLLSGKEDHVIVKNVDPKRQETSRANLKTIDGEFPPVDKVYEVQKKTIKAQVTLNPDYLEKICKYAKDNKLGKDAKIKVIVREDLNPVEFHIETEDGTAEILLMPIIEN